MAVVRLYPEKSKPHIINALKNKTWLMRNAGLIAMEIINPQSAVFFAQLLLNDASLIVRTSAVEVIRRNKAVQYKDLLWRELYKKENFRHGKSLWIRQSIAKTLLEFSNREDLPLFARLKKDSDPALQKLADSALSGLKDANSIILSADALDSIKIEPLEPVGF